MAPWCYSDYYTPQYKRVTEIKKPTDEEVLDDDDKMFHFELRVASKRPQVPEGLSMVSVPGHASRPLYVHTVSRDWCVQTVLTILSLHSNTVVCAVYKYTASRLESLPESNCKKKKKNRYIHSSSSPQCLYF